MIIPFLILPQVLLVRCPINRIQPGGKIREKGSGGARSPWAGRCVHLVSVATRLALSRGRWIFGGVRSPTEHVAHESNVEQELQQALLRRVCCQTPHRRNLCTELRHYLHVALKWLKDLKKLLHQLEHKTSQHGQLQGVTADAMYLLAGRVQVRQNMSRW
eukprot:scaffold1290_cov367-Prasinococcus_capsulatus_cf.AAC.10